MLTKKKTKKIGEGVYKHGKPWVGTFPQVFASCGVSSRKSVYKDGLEVAELPYDAEEFSNFIENYKNVNRRH